MASKVLHAAVLAVAGVLMDSSAMAAEAYPTRPVRVIVPYGAGGSADVLTRIVVARLPELLGQQVVVDNRTGAGGLIGTDIVAKSVPDGHTLLATGTPHVIFPNLHQKVPYRPLEDFAPIMQTSSQPYGLVVHPSLGVTSVKELIALAQKEPGRHNYASSGQGGAMHLFQALFVRMANINIVHVPYKDSGPVRSDLLGGQVKIGCLGLSSILPSHRAGQLRIIAVTGAKRSPELPDVPAVAEALPGYEAVLWTGLLAPRGTPAAIIKRMHGDVTKLLATPEVRTAYQKAGTDVIATDPQAFGELLRVEFAKWGKVVRELGLKAN